jgi:hypothetical protein
MTFDQIKLLSRILVGDEVVLSFALKRQLLLPNISLKARHFVSLKIVEVEPQISSIHKLRRERSHIVTTKQLREF